MVSFFCYNILMFKREREAEDASFKPHPILRSVKSFDYRAEKEVIQAELNREKQVVSG